MSRSFKHSGWIQDRSSKKFGKRYANKKVRRCSEVSNGKSYRKVFETYNIADFILQARGVLEIIQSRPGRMHRIIRLDKDKKSPWSFLDKEYESTIWKDWNK